LKNLSAWLALSRFAVHIPGSAGFCNAQVGFASKVNFPVAVGLCIFRVLAEEDICQLKRAMAHAIMLSTWPWDLLLGAESCVLRRHPTRHAADGGYAARFLSLFLALSFVRFDGESPLATHRS
jgi:hypothetical protein